MKLKLTTLLLLIVATILSAQSQTDDQIAQKEYTAKLKFCESTLPYKNMILVSNFGTQELNPLNQEGKGYIVSITGKEEPQIFIPADGSLSAPKGMVIVDNHLYIADVNKVVVYNLKKLNERSRIIKFPEQDLFVNDLVAIGDLILVTVTNTGNIYGINTTRQFEAPKLMGNVPGANGIAIYDTYLYVASYDSGEKPSADNVIYYSDFSVSQPQFSKLIKDLTPSQYDGIAVSEDGQTLYFTTWVGKNGNGGEIYTYSLKNKGNVRVIDLGVTLQGPADISIKNNILWVPELPSSKVHRLPL